MRFSLPFFLLCGGGRKQNDVGMAQYRQSGADRFAASGRGPPDQHHATNGATAASISTSVDQIAVRIPHHKQVKIRWSGRFDKNRRILIGICLGMQIAVIEYGNVKYVDERHRHRYEVNPDMIPELEAAGISFFGKDETGRRMEILELPKHPYFVGVQFHPEFKSRPGKPSALFLELVLEEALKRVDSSDPDIVSAIIDEYASRPVHKVADWRSSISASRKER